MDSLLKSLEKHDKKGKGKRSHAFAAPILRQSTFSLHNETTEVDLIVLSPLNLGITKNLPLRDFVKIVCDTGQFGVCPQEVGPQLYLQYPEQPNSRVGLTIAADPIAFYDNSRSYHAHPLKPLQYAYLSVGKYFKVFNGQQLLSYMAEFSDNPYLTPASKLVFQIIDNPEEKEN